MAYVHNVSTGVGLRTRIWHRFPTLQRPLRAAVSTRLRAPVRIVCAKSDIGEDASDSVAAKKGRGRLFSNVEETDTGELKRVQASELGCAALIAGTMVGAGVLATPTVTAPIGYFPSAATLLLVWAYMVSSALLITEVSVSTLCSLGRPSGVSLLSLGRITLGPAGGLLTAAAYTFLHYAILTAYTAQGGAVLSHLYVLFAHSSPVDFALSPAFALAIGGALFALSDDAVEQMNNVLVLGVIVSFALCVATLSTSFDASRLLHVGDLGAVPHAVPVLLVSCVFHNIVGSVAARLEGDVVRIRRAILTGSAVPLAMFLAYNAAVLGAGGEPGIVNGSGGSAANVAVDAFSLLAIATSFVGFVAGLVDLWSDVRVSLLHEQPDAVQRSLGANYAATVLPPIAMCAINPDVFFRALDLAGTYGIAVLFGFLPAAMAWRNREKIRGFPRALPGGRPVLALLMAAPVVLIVEKIFGVYSHAW